MSKGSTYTSHWNFLGCRDDWDSDTEETVAVFQAHNHKPMFYDLLWFLKGIWIPMKFFLKAVVYTDMILLWFLLWRNGIRGRHSTQSQFERHYVTVIYSRTLMQINLHNYCSFTQWMSSALTAAVPSCNQSRNFWITSHKWNFFLSKTHPVLSGSGDNQEALFQAQVATEVYIYIYGFKNNSTHWLTLIWLFSCIGW
jgi:hypothetical protein